MVMNYRVAGQAKFTAVEMTYRFKELVARIPASATAVVDSRLSDQRLRSAPVERRLFSTTARWPAYQRRRS